MRFFSEKKAGSPSASLDNGQYVNNYAGEEVAYDDDLHAQCPPHTTERKLVAKIDWHVLPFLCILYLLGECGALTAVRDRLADSATLAFLDRVNIANAAVYGLEKELHLTGDQYNIALVIFFVPYVIFEIPSNVSLAWQTSLSPTY
jgi:hypothetical protein